MSHRHPHKPVHHVKPKYKRLALIAAAAAVLSTTALPGMSAPLAHASASTNAGGMSATTSQQVGKTTSSSSQINLGDNLTTKTPKHPKQEHKVPPVSQKNAKIPIVTPTATKENNEKIKPPQPSENISAIPVETPTATEKIQEKNKVTESGENTTPPPIATPTLKEESNFSSSDNAPSRYQEVLDISATAYAPGPHDNEQWGTKTHIGTEVRPGIIAVDPNLIPLGSRVYIEYPDGHGEYATAEDTGGAIKGNRIDIAKQTVSEAENFGIQKVKVYVISTPQNV